MPPQVDINRLFESLEIMEQQREIVGDAVEPLITEIKGQILEQAQTPEPTDEQRRVAESWQTVVSTSDELGLEAPSATDDIAEAVTAVESYTQLMSRLGGTGLNETVEQPAPTEKASTPVKPKATPKEKVAKVTKPKATAPEIQPQEKPDTRIDVNSLGEVDGDVVIVGGKKPFKAADSTKQMYVDFFRELANSPDGSFETTQFVRRITGGLSAKEIQLILSGTKEAPEGIDINKANSENKRFYGVLRTLRDNNLVEHTSGSGDQKKGEIKLSVPGIVRAFGDVTFSEESDGALRIGAVAKPYDVKIDSYEQTIDNGRGKELSFEKKEILTFERIAQAIGSIALSPDQDHAKFTRRDIANWMKADHGVDLSLKELAAVSKHLIEVIDEFDRDFPLLNHGKKGGGRFSWETGTNVEIIEGLPEKPNFNDPVTLRINENSLSVVIEDIEYELADYNKGAALMKGLDLSFDDMTRRTKKLFEVLGCMGPTDSLTSDMVYEMMGGREATDSSKRIFTNWFRRMATKLNNVRDEQIVNWKKHGHIIDVDVNRTFAIEEVGEESASPKAEKGGGPEDAVPVDTTAPAPETVNSEESVKPRLTATEAAEAIGRLDENTKSQISGRLIRHGSFDYPKSLAEAAYLLSILSNNAVIAEVREGAFRRKDEAEYKAFIAEVLYSCYLRTKSWGSFEDLSAAITKLEDGTTSKLVKRHIQHFQRTTDAAVESIWSDEDRTDEKQRDRKYAESVLENLLVGSLPKPRSAIQGIVLLDTFKENRAEIAKSMGTAEFEKLVQDMHDAVSSKKVLGGNSLTALESRSGPYVHRSNRHGGVVQTAGEASKDTVMSRTDFNRRPGARNGSSNGSSTPARSTRRRKTS